MTTELKSMMSWIKALVTPEALPESHSALDFDPSWHGDHWQNLLSSPMDARRYVMEDWTVSAPAAFEAAVSTTEEPLEEEEAA
jgi:hypothetical protein